MDLRVLLIQLLGKIAKEYPQAGLTAYVDDTTVEATGTVTFVVASLSGAGAALSDGLLQLGLALLQRIRWWLRPPPWRKRSPVTWAFCRQGRTAS